MERDAGHMGVRQTHTHGTGEGMGLFDNLRKNKQSTEPEATSPEHAATLTSLFDEPPAADAGTTLTAAVPEALAMDSAPMDGAADELNPVERTAASLFDLGTPEPTRRSEDSAEASASDKLSALTDTSTSGMFDHPARAFEPPPLPNQRATDVPVEPTAPPAPLAEPASDPHSANLETANLETAGLETAALETTAESFFAQTTEPSPPPTPTPTPPAPSFLDASPEMGGALPSRRAARADEGSSTAARSNPFAALDAIAQEHSLSPDLATPEVFTPGPAADHDAHLAVSESGLTSLSAGETDNAATAYVEETASRPPATVAEMGLLAFLGLPTDAAPEAVSTAHENYILAHQALDTDTADEQSRKRLLRRQVNTAYASYRLTLAA